MESQKKSHCRFPLSEVLFSLVVFIVLDMGVLLVRYGKLSAVTHRLDILWLLYTVVAILSCLLFAFDYGPLPYNKKAFHHRIACRVLQLVTAYISSISWLTYVNRKNGIDNGGNWLYLAIMFTLFGFPAIRHLTLHAVCDPENDRRYEEWHNRYKEWHAKDEARSLEDRSAEWRILGRCKIPSGVSITMDDLPTGAPSPGTYFGDELWKEYSVYVYPFEYSSHHPYFHARKSCAVTGIEMHLFDAIMEGYQPCPYCAKAYPRAIPHWYMTYQELTGKDEYYYPGRY